MISWPRHGQRWYHCYRRFHRDHVTAYYYTNYRMTVLQLVSYDTTVEV
jgi:hypothetical protein